MYKPMNKGRYYRIFVESINGSFKITHTDLIGVVVSGNSVKLPLGYHIINVDTDVNTVIGGSASTFGTRKVYADGCQAVELCDSKSFDFAEIFVFAYKKE